MGSPRISVLVTAYNRKKYLLGAVKSALNQTLPRDRYEVIVVKNFRDDFIDSKLEEWGVINLYSEQERSGAMAYDGVEVARGDVICFLDDDDEYEQIRLEVIARAFQEDDVDFFSNARQYVDESGHVLKRERRRSTAFKV
ncbi:MAG: glycosyltransferase family 2 protein, partial [Thermoprotei archaeon]